MTASLQVWAVALSHALGQGSLGRDAQSGMAECLGRRTRDPVVPGSIPGQAGISYTLGKGVLL